MKIKVRYPLTRGELLLRAEPDWDRSLRPSHVDRRRHTHTFDLPDDAPSRWVKPVVADGADVRWARGENSLVLRDAGEVAEVFPFFDADERCHECTVHEVPSSFDARGYEVRVFLPPGYAENELQRYPVLYMQDGHNLFFADEAAFGSHWRVAETIALLERMSLVRQVVVVGIRARDRETDYTSPGYERYGRFVVDELKPWVDARYRTSPAAVDTAVIGSSLGGVVSFWLGWRHPEVFGHVAALSATFGWRDDLLARVLAEPRPKTRIYLDSGWPNDNYERTRSMAAALRGRGAAEGRDLVYVAWPEAKHDEASWAARLHVPFQFFFRR